jgi:hypothetical protein
MAILKNTIVNDTGFVVLPSGSSGQRPASPTTGMIRYNTTISKVEFYNGSSWEIFVQETVPTSNRATGGSRTVVNGNYIHRFNYNLVHNSIAEATATHNDANWRTMKTFTAPLTGKIDVRFTAYISSGTHYWAYRIRKNATTTIGTGGFQNGPFWGGDTASVHAYQRFISRDNAVNAGDSITVEMISSNGSEAPVTGNGQILYLKDLFVYQSAQQFIPENDGVVEVLVVGAGGSGGGDVGGGGGGGQVLYSSTFRVVANTATDITVGDGAYPALFNQYGVTGRSSSASNALNTVTALGGGGGSGRTTGGASPNTGWTGGGGSLDFANTSGNGGYAGGDSGGRATGTNGNGGGGGAGGPGIAGTTSQAGRGGPGIAHAITGQSVFYGAGGGGSYYTTTNIALAGLGGRGQNDIRGRGGVEAAGVDRIFGVDGQNDVGAGGGGGPTSGAKPNAGKGGSGTVIIRFPAITSNETLGTVGNPAVNGLALLAAGKPSGIYYIQPSGGTAIQCYVDNDTDGGGWVLIHKHNSNGTSSDTNDRTDSGYGLISLQSPTFYNDTRGEVAIAPLAFMNSTSFSTWKVSTPTFGSGRAKMFWWRPDSSKLAYYTTDKSAGSDRITTAWTYYKWNDRQGYFLDDAFNSGSHGLCLGDWDSNYSAGQHICINRFCCGTPNGGLWMNNSPWRLEDDNTATFSGDEFALLGWAR